TGIQCRIDGDKLQAKADVLVSRLQLAKAGGRDEAQARVGLPLGMLVSLMKDRHGDIRLALPIAGRLTDPRVDFKQLVWSTVRNATLKLITAPVSFTGRVRVDADSRIERVEVDPIQFEPGTATPTSEGQQQLTRLVAFLDQTPEARLTATPVVSARDLDGMKPPATDATKQPAVDAAKQPADDAAAAKRMESVRATLRKAGIDSSRLTEARPVENADAGASEVKLDFAEPESPGRR